jgi:hypothetical protein
MGLREDSRQKQKVEIGKIKGQRKQKVSKNMHKGGK